MVWNLLNRVLLEGGDPIPPFRRMPGPERETTHGGITLSRLSIETPGRAQTVLGGLYRDMGRRISASPPGLCPVDMSLNFLRLCHAQTCGKCVPCRVGLGQLESLIEQVLDQTAGPEIIDLIETTAQVIAEQLSAVGITAKVQEVEWNSWLQDVYTNREFESTVIGFDASNLTANALLQRWVSDSDKNMIGFSDSQYDQLIAAANATTDDAERTSLYKEAERVLTEQAANVYLQDLADFVAVNKNLTGYEFYPLYVMDLANVAYSK